VSWREFSCGYPGRRDHAIDEVNIKKGTHRRAWTSMRTSSPPGLGTGSSLTRNSLVSAFNSPANIASLVATLILSTSSLRLSCLAQCQCLSKSCRAQVIPYRKRASYTNFLGSYWSVPRFPANSAARRDSLDCRRRTRRRSPLAGLTSPVEIWSNDFSQIGLGGSERAESHRRQTG
jgi:hypothetical protein